jgi:hypothetical protein
VGVAVFGAIANSTLAHRLQHPPAELAGRLPRSVDTTSLVLGGTHPADRQVGAFLRGALFDAVQRRRGADAAVVVAAVAVVGLLSNVPLANSDHATDAGKYVQAALDAKRARRWAPWSPEPWERLGDAATAAGYDDAAAVAYRKALAKDGGDWTLWFDLATVTTGAEQRHAVAEVRRLNPRNPGIGASG